MDWARSPSPRPENGFSKPPTFFGFLLQFQASQMVLELQLTINKDPGKAGNVNVRHPLPTLQPATDGGGGSRPTAPWLGNRQSESEISKPLSKPARSETIPSPSVRERVGRGCTTTRPWRFTKIQPPARWCLGYNSRSKRTPASRERQRSPPPPHPPARHGWRWRKPIYSVLARQQAIGI